MNTTDIPVMVESGTLQVSAIDPDDVQATHYDSDDFQEFQEFQDTQEDTQDVKLEFSSEQDNDRDGAMRHSSTGDSLFYIFLGGLRVTNPTNRLACLSVNILLVNTITQQILAALGPNLYHGCISGVYW